MRTVIGWLMRAPALDWVDWALPDALKAALPVAPLYHSDPDVGRYIAR